MAKARSTEKMGAVEVDFLNCPICDQLYTLPIYNCQSGHSLCAKCNSRLPAAFCPQCRQPMTQMRNHPLEKMVSQVKVQCPNKGRGCIYNLMTQEVEDHTRDCIFREMACPLGAVFGKCSWIGLFRDLMNHFKERHPENCDVNPNSEVELDNISLNVDDRHVFLVAQNKNLFIITTKIDTIHNMVYWVVQLIGSQKTAQQHVYEIHIDSKQDDRRKVMFYEYCINDDTKPEEIFREGKCAIMPFNMLNHFISDNKLAFKFITKKVSVDSKQNFEKGGRSRPHSRGPKGSGPEGPRTSRSPESRGPPTRGRPRNRGFSHSTHRNFSASGSKSQSNNNHPFNFNDKKFL